ncbi:MAG: glucokinase [Glaciecola sp.]|jgi:glucokinase
MVVRRAIGVDAGGTNLRVALVDETGLILAQRRVLRPKGSVSAFLDAVLGLHGELTAGLADPAIGVGFGVASIVWDRRVAVFGPNLKLPQTDLIAALGARGISQVTVENDATAAMFGEWQVGAARGMDNAVLVTLGTGIGGGIVVHGELLRGANGFAAEVGHLTIIADGRACACGRRGCLEAYASGSAIPVEARERLGAGGASSLASLDVIDGAAVSAAAEKGDALAIATLEQVGRWLGAGLTSLVNLLDPEVVVIGGGVARAIAPWTLPVAQSIMAAELEGAALRIAPPMVGARLGDDAGIVGAALLALESHPQERT